MINLSLEFWTGVTTSIVAAFILSVIGLLVRGGRYLYVFITQTKKQVSDLERRINEIEDLFRSLSLSGKRTTKNEIDFLSRKMDRFMERIEPHVRGNPISQEELQRFKFYNQKIRKKEPFSFDEYMDYRRIADAIKNDLSGGEKNDFEKLLEALIPIAAGAFMGYLTAELLESLSSSAGKKKLKKTSGKKKK